MPCPSSPRFAAFAPSAQAGWYDSYYSSGSYRCYDEDGDRVPCRTYNKVLPSIPGVPGYLQRHVEGVLGVAPISRLQALVQLPRGVGAGALLRLEKLAALVC